MRQLEKPPDENKLFTKHRNVLLELVSTYTNQRDTSGELKQLVKKYNDTEYIHWNELRYKKLPRDPEVIWLFLTFLRKGTYRPIKIGKETFRFIMLDRFQRHLHLIDKASPASFDWLVEDNLSESGRQQYLINSLMEEAIASSQLEGAATTRPVAKKMLREGKKPKNQSERMILNNYLTIRKLQQWKNLPLSRELILEIHQEITQSTLESEADEKQFRTTNDVVVRDKVDYKKIYHYPPDFNEIPAMIEDLCAFANGEEEFIHPIIKAIIIHFLIGYIHPFNDGNGRTARALFYWYVLKHRYDLFEYLSISRIVINAPAKYTRAYLETETDGNDMTYFIDFNMNLINKALEELKRYIVEKQKEEKDLLQLVEQMPDLSFRQAEMLKDFIKHPTRPYTVSELAGKFKISIPTARVDLLTLEGKGQLKKYLDGNRQVFIYRGDHGE
jgi:Fic family protein